MTIGGSKNVQLGLMLATVLSFSFWPAPASAYTPEQQQACSGDAFRLCGPEIPDVDRVTACMIRNKSQLSPGCRAFFRPGPEFGRERGHAGRPADGDQTRGEQEQHQGAQAEEETCRDLSTARCGNTREKPIPPSRVVSSAGISSRDCATD